MWQRPDKVTKREDYGDEREGKRIERNRYAWSDGINSNMTVRSKELGERENTRMQTISTNEKNATNKRKKTESEEAKNKTKKTRQRKIQQQ